MFTNENSIQTARSHMTALFGFTLGVVLCVSAVASELDQLVKELQSGDAHTRVRARQLLPRHGADAVDALLPLLANEDQGIRSASFNVLADLSNGVAAGPDEAVRARVVKAQMAYLATEQPTKVKQQILRLLPIAFREGDDLAPLAALLSDKDLHEKARATLEQLGTPGACAELLSAVPKFESEPAFIAALVHAAGNTHQQTYVKPILDLTTNADAGVRAAAAHAISWTGSPDAYPRLREVMTKATPETRFEATDAVLRLADAMVKNGGNWDMAITIYKDVLHTAPTMPLKCAALAGLGNYGDDTVVPIIIGALTGADASLVDSATVALGSLQGRDAVRAVKAAYASLPKSAQLGMVAIWGQHQEKEALDIIKQELKSQDARVKTTALHALGGMATVDAFPALMEVAQSGSEEERAFAMKAAVGVADSLDKAGNPAEAGKAYVTLYSIAPNDDVRMTALRGIAAAPVPDAFDSVKAAIAQPALKDAAVNALVSVAGSLAAAHDEAKAKDAIALVRHAEVSPEVLVSLAQKLQGTGVPADFSNLLGVVKTWSIIGPFDWKTDQDWATAFVGEPKIDLKATYQINGKPVTWSKVTTGDPIGVVNLGVNIGQRDRCFGYAFAVIEVPDAVDGEIRIGSDDGNKIWVNGAVVAENRVDRGMALDQDKVKVHLNKGRNEILVKISQGGGGWVFCARLASPNGAGLVFTQPD